MHLGQLSDHFHVRYMQQASVRSLACIITLPELETKSILNALKAIPNKK